MIFSNVFSILGWSLMIFGLVNRICREFLEDAHLDWEATLAFPSHLSRVTNVDWIDCQQWVTSVPLYLPAVHGNKSLEDHFSKLHSLNSWWYCWQETLDPANCANENTFPYSFLLGVGGCFFPLNPQSLKQSFYLVTQIFYPTVCLNCLSMLI